MTMTGAQRQARHILKLKLRAAAGDAAVARLAQIEAQQADAHLARREARHVAAPSKRRGKAAAHAR
jgi:hypothetical protein